jgi:AraC-like DNA-binding protein
MAAMSRAEPEGCVKAIRAPFFAAAARTGRPLPELAAEAGIEVALLTDTAARIPHSQIVHVWESFAARCGDPVFGLTAAAIVGVPRLDAIDYVLQRSANVREMLDRFMRYQRLFHDANAVSAVERGDLCELHLRFQGELSRSRHFIEFILAMWTGRFHSFGLGGEIRRVSFRHAAAADRAAYTRSFGDAVRFDADHDGIAIPRALLEAPLPEADPSFAQSFEAQLERELAELRTGTTFPDEVRDAIARLIGSGDSCEIDAVARRLAVSARTLQRRLTDDGTSFRELVDLVRRDVALRSVRGAAANLTDLAFLLGFSEVSAFSRAFRRWTGKSPTEYLREGR